MTSHASSYAAYPLVDEKPPTERPPWEPRTRFEMEKDITQLQAVHRQLGDSVAWIVDTLLLDDKTQEEKADDHTKSVKERKREAIESLAYVRDVLKGLVPPGQVEEDRLLSEDEVKRRRDQTKKDAAEATASTASTASNAISESARRSSDSPPQLRATLTPPKPAAITLPRFPSHSSTPSRRPVQDYFSSRSPPQPSSLPPSTRVKELSPSPVPPTSSVLTPNKSSVPLAPWNYTPSAFSKASTTPNLPRMPSKPSAVATPRQHNGSVRVTSPYSDTTSTSQTPTGSDQPPPTVSNSQQDPLGVSR